MEDIRVAPTADWTGTDAVEVPIVPHPTAARQLGTTGKGCQMLNDLGETPRDMGESRFAHRRYATQEELAGIDGPESRARAAAGPDALRASLKNQSSLAFPGSFR